MLGRSTKEAVRAALGEAIVVDFESGYEVWVYKERPARDAARDPVAPRPELVLLFDPSGRLARTHIR